MIEKRNPFITGYNEGKAVEGISIVNLQTNGDF